jgi:DNA-directed RNA polymerase subunit RPC12/RpoP
LRDGTDSRDATIAAAEFNSDERPESLMRIECSSCGSRVKIRTNENGEVNCPHCGVGLLTMPSMREAEIDRYSDLGRKDEFASFTPRSTLGPMMAFAAILIAIGLAVIGFIVSRQ